ncbi:MAG: hypothetical protein ACKOHI_05485, partial [Phycisphaerales bacterium]
RQPVEERVDPERARGLGDRMDVVLDAGGTRLVARIGNDDRLREGEAAHVTVDVGAAHLFAPGEAGTRVRDSGDR